MTPAAWSLVALLLAIGLSCTSRINVGVVALALAWPIGASAGLSAETVAASFPASLFLTLAGVSLLFGLAEENGTLGVIAGRATGLCHGREGLVPLLLFVTALALAALGPGAISSVALLVPMAMVVGQRAGLTPVLIALMVALGANAGNFSPISPAGVIAREAMARAELVGHDWRVFVASFVAHVAAGAVAWAIFGKRGHGSDLPTAPPSAATSGNGGRQAVTVAIIGLWVIGVTTLRLPLGLSAFAAAALLVIARAGSETAAVKRVPWGVLLMVSGVTTLIAVVEKAGGLELFTSLLARLASPATVNGAIAFVTALVSTYSSTTGVVLPAFLPTASSLAAKVGGGDPLAVALSISVGASLVDVSPLSTLGALCVAAVPDGEPAETLFRQLLVWGLSMTLVGALFCQAFAGLLARL